MKTKDVLMVNAYRGTGAPGKLRKVQIRFDPDKCNGTYQCFAVCPVGCWTPDRANRKVIFHDPEKCIACGACVLQCPQDAIELR